MELPFPIPVEGLCVNLVDYLKWRGENSHVGLGQLWNDEPRIWVPSTEGLDDMPLNAGLQGRREHTAPLVFRLLDLPAELRNGVYEAIFNPYYGHDRSEDYNFKHVDITASVHHTIASLKQALSNPILRTSRQVRCEALPVLFSSTTWRVSNLSDFPAFFNVLGPSCCASLRTIWIEDQYFPGTWDPQFTRSLVKIINNLPSLKKLFIDLCINTCDKGMPHDGTIDLFAFPNLAELSELRGLDELKLSFAGLMSRCSLSMSWAEREKTFQERRKRIRRHCHGPRRKEVADMLAEYQSRLGEHVHLPRYQHPDDDTNMMGDVGHTLPLLVRPLAIHPQHRLMPELLETEDEAEGSEDESTDDDGSVNGDIDRKLMDYEMWTDEGMNDSAFEITDDEFEDEDFEDWLDEVFFDGYYGYGHGGMFFQDN